MHASSCECAAENRNHRRGYQTPSPSDFVGERTTAQSANTGAEKEEGVDGAEDGVSVWCSGAGLREGEVCEESGLADRGGEGGEAWVGVRWWGLAVVEVRYRSRR